MLIRIDLKPRPLLDSARTSAVFSWNPHHHVVCWPLALVYIVFNLKSCCYLVTVSLARSQILVIRV